MAGREYSFDADHAQCRPRYAGHGPDIPGDEAILGRMTDPNDDTPPLGSVDAEPLEAKSRAPEPEGTESAASIAAGERSGQARDHEPASEANQRASDHHPGCGPYSIC